MYQNAILKPCYTCLQFFLLIFCLQIPVQLSAGGGKDELSGREIPVRFSFWQGDAKLGSGNATHVSLDEDIKDSIQQIRIRISLSEEVHDELGLELKFADAQPWETTPSFTYIPEGNQILLTIDIPRGCVLKPGPLFTMYAYAGIFATPVGLKIAAIDGIVITVSINDFKMAAPIPIPSPPSPMLIIDLVKGKIVAQYDASVILAYEMALQGLPKGLYCLIDPSGTIPSKKFYID